MVRHIVTWNYKEGLSDEENRENALKLKADIEALDNIVEGILELKVYINELSTSNRDIVVNSLFTSEEALANYIVHPEHKKVGELIGKALQDRACIDYYE